MTYLTAHHLSGWSITYTGGRIADIYTPKGYCVDCVQVRPWDHSKNPTEQAPFTVTYKALYGELEAYLGGYRD